LDKLGQVKEISKTKGFISRKICFQNCMRGSIKQGEKYFKTRSKGPLRSQELDKTALLLPPSSPPIYVVEAQCWVPFFVRKMCKTWQVTPSKQKTLELA